MNKVILMGRLTKDPELQQTPSGVSVCRFGLAVNRRFAKEGQQSVDFLNCTAWRQTAEFISKYFTKGAMLAVVGSVQTSVWQDNSGKNNYSTGILVDEAYFTGSKRDSGGENAPDDMTAAGFEVIGGDESVLPFQGHERTHENEIYIPA